MRTSLAHLISILQNERGLNTPDNYCKRFYRGELEHTDTFSQRVLSEKPKFIQKRKEHKK